MSLSYNDPALLYPNAEPARTDSRRYESLPRSSGYGGFHPSGGRGGFRGRGGYRGGGRSGPRRGSGAEVETWIRERHDRERPSRTLFVRNVDFDVAERELRSRFAEFGELADFFSRIHGRGLAFVTFYDLRDAMRAKDMLNGAAVGARPLDVHFSLPRETITPDLRCDESKHQGTVLVTFQDSHAAERVTDDELKRVFTKFGEICQVSTREETSPEQRYIEFYDARACSRAVRALHMREEFGSPLRVEWAWDRAMREAMYLNEQNRERDSYFRKFDRPGRVHRARSRSRSRDRQRARSRSPPPYRHEDRDRQGGYSSSRRQRAEFSPPRDYFRPKHSPPAPSAASATSMLLNTTAASSGMYGSGYRYSKTSSSTATATPANNHFASMLSGLASLTAPQHDAPTSASAMPPTTSALSQLSAMFPQAAQQQQPAALSGTATANPYLAALSALYSSSAGASTPPSAYSSTPSTMPSISATRSAPSANPSISSLSQLYQASLNSSGGIPSSNSHR